MMIASSADADVPDLPQEILDRILLLCDVHVAIGLNNDYVKRKLLPWYRARKPKDTEDTSIIALFDKWVEEYQVGSKIVEPPQVDGGLLQLIGYGLQDLYLTGSPQTTFFRTIDRRHTNFAMESLPI